MHKYICIYIFMSLARPCELMLHVFEETKLRDVNGI